MEDLVGALVTPNFVEKAALVILAFLLTGVSVPYIKSRVDQETFRKQKLFDAALARQSKVIEAQTTFIADFSKYIWEYHTRRQRVSHFRIVGDDQDYEKALSEYQNSIWDSLRQMRSAIGSARWFTSDETHQLLTDYYEKWFVKLDQELRLYISEDYPTDKWQSRHWEVHYEAGPRNYGLLDRLANEFGLRESVGNSVTSPQSMPPNNSPERTRESGGNLA